jgi:membrane protein DedA with SNARE-associated domain
VGKTPGDAMQQIASQAAGFEADTAGRRSSFVILPFAHEDIAIVIGAYFAANHLLAGGLVIAAVAGTILASDFALYAIGAAARRLPWLARRVIDGRVRGLGDALMRDLFAFVAMCRFVPGLVVVSGIACGWTRVSFARFTLATIFVSASYVVMMLYLITVFGDALDDHIGLWAYPLLLVVLGCAAFARRRILAFRGTAVSWRGESIRPH